MIQSLLGFFLAAVSAAAAADTFGPAQKKPVDPTKGFFSPVAATVGPYISLGTVQTFEGGTQVFPSIRSISGVAIRAPSAGITKS